MRDRYKISDQNSVYFITSTIIEWLPVFTNNKYCDILIDSLKHCIENKSLNLYAYVILDNHFHLIGSAPELSKTISSVKKYSARMILKQLEDDNRNWLINQMEFFKKKFKKESDHQVWQEGYHPVLISDQDVFVQKVEYIHNNPVKRGLVDLPECWRYSSARNYLMDDHSIISVNCEMS